MKRKNIGFILLCGLCLLVFYSIWLYHHLDVGEEPRPSEVIIVPEGIGQERSQKASELLHEGYSSSGQVVVSPLVDESHQTDFRGIYHQAGIEQDQISPENQATSTFSNATNTLKMMQDNDWTSAIIVTSDYHTRRTRMIYNRVNKDYGFNLCYVSAYRKDESGQAISYLDDEETRHYAWAEVIKYYGYLLRLYNVIDL